MSSDRVIDAALHRMPAGHWRMWYKDEVKGSHTWAADSDDLYHWTVEGPVIADCAHEGPNVFFWRGFYRRASVRALEKRIGAKRKGDLQGRPYYVFVIRASHRLAPTRLVRY